VHPEPLHARVQIWLVPETRQIPPAQSVSASHDSPMAPSPGTQTASEQTNPTGHSDPAPVHSATHRLTPSTGLHIEFWHWESELQASPSMPAEQLQ
jgi:hypothetical protein